ncbi:hypothetical protein [Mucilaginibacter sp. PAMB04168]|uniref:hypothetical protein n=1 Tax=Mucilaginibacter sp. PAMB04168 TaxID=3138567 RepID=UPI0031F6EEEA
MKQPIMKGTRARASMPLGAQNRLVKRSVRTDLDCAVAKRRAGFCCAAGNLLNSSETDCRHGRISDESGILF